MSSKSKFHRFSKFIKTKVTLNAPGDEAIVSLIVKLRPVCFNCSLAIYSASLAN